MYATTWVNLKNLLLKKKRPDAKDHILDHIKDHIWFHLSETSRKGTPIKQTSGCLRLEVEMDSDHKQE